MGRNSVSDATSLNNIGEGNLTAWICAGLQHKTYHNKIILLKGEAHFSPPYRGRGTLRHVMMKLKHIIPIILVVAIVLCLSGCKEKTDLDPYVKPDITENNNGINPTDPTQPDQTVEETTATVEDTAENPPVPGETVGEWPNPEDALASKKDLFHTSSEWVADGSLTDGIYTETASLRDGGKVELMFYYEFFQQATLILTTNSYDERVAQTKSFVKSYLDRDLTEYEVFAIKSALQNVDSTDDIVTISGIKGLGAYVTKNDTGVQVICS